MQLLRRRQSAAISASGPEAGNSDIAGPKKDKAAVVADGRFGRGA